MTYYPHTCVQSSPSWNHPTILSQPLAELWTGATLPVLLYCHDATGLSAGWLNWQPAEPSTHLASRQSLATFGTQMQHSNLLPCRRLATHSRMLKTAAAAFCCINKAPVVLCCSWCSCKCFPAILVDDVQHNFPALKDGPPEPLLVDSKCPHDADDGHSLETHQLALIMLRTGSPGKEGCHILGLL